MDRYSIEIQQPSKNWMTIRYIIPYNTQTMFSEMEQVKKVYPNSRVRVVDKDGRLIDMLD
jgi:hypothetical protein